MNDKTFISRWSRLKSERAAQEKTTEAEDAPYKPEIASLATDDITLTEASSAFPETLPDKQSSEQPLETDNFSSENNQALTEIPPLTDEDMPPVESLSEKSDFSQFLSSGVSDELRNLALRKLFNLPQFNVRDELNDYDGDFSKIPVLTQEVAAKMRSWIHDKQDQLTSDINEELREALNTDLNEELTEEPEKTLIEKPPLDTPNLTATYKRTDSATQTEHFIDTDDDLGDADLHG